jgi:NAD-dependent oxidoreductase involved in siderophore biosynthesis
MPTGGVERYKQYAAECLRIAQQTTDNAQKARLLEMAEAWQRLAEAAGKQEEK